MEKLQGSRSNFAVYSDNLKYLYCLQKVKNGKKYFKCRSDTCNARLVAKIDNPMYLTNGHNHEPCIEDYHQLKFLTILKRRAETEDTPLSEIFRQEQVLRPSAANTCGGFSGVRSSLYRARQKRTQNLEEHSTSLSDIR